MCDVRLAISLTSHILFEAKAFNRKGAKIFRKERKVLNISGINFVPFVVS